MPTPAPSGRSVPSLLQRAAYLLELGRAKDALPLIREALVADPGSSEAHCYLSQVCLAENHLADALDAARRAIALEPEDEWGYRLSAIVFLRLGCVQDAVSAAGDAVRCSPHGREALYTLADSLLSARELDRAAEVADQLSCVAPEWFQTHFVLTHIAREAGRLPEAEEHIRLALALDPERAHLLQELGTVLQCQGRSLDALEAYDLAARQDPRRAAERTRLIPHVEPWAFATLLRDLGLRACASMIAAAFIVVILHPKDPRLWTGWITLVACGVSSYAPLRHWWEGRRRVRPEVMRLFEMQRRKEWLAALAVVAILSGILGTIVWTADVALRWGTHEAPGMLEMTGWMALTTATACGVLAGIRNSLRERAGVAK